MFWKLSLIKQDFLITSANTHVSCQPLSLRLRKVKNDFSRRTPRGSKITICTSKTTQIFRYHNFKNREYGFPVLLNIKNLRKGTTKCLGLLKVVVLILDGSIKIP
jgi:hypothetical protein